MCSLQGPDSPALLHARLSPQLGGGDAGWRGRDTRLAGSEDIPGAIHSAEQASCKFYQEQTGERLVGHICKYMANLFFTCQPTELSWWLSGAYTYRLYIIIRTCPVAGDFHVRILFMAVLVEDG